ncbi:MAG TPA: lysophospholipid acyltransferase family protein [Acidimicrobiales bacterium]
MSRIPVTPKQATELLKRLPINRAVATSAGKAGAAAVVRRVVPSTLRSPTVPGGVEPLPAVEKYGASYDTDWARTYPARTARVLLVEGVVRPAMEMLASPTINGLDRLDDLDGPVIFAANHHSHVDTPLLLSSLPEPWRHHLFIAAGADYFFTNRVTSTLSALVIGAIPIERQKVARNSAEKASELLRDGWSLLIFPEGGRSPDGWGHEFRGGAAYLALKCGVPIVPIHVEGTGRILRKGKNVPRATPTRVTFGTPLVPGEDEDSRRLAARIEASVAELADESSSDWWQARRRAAAGETPSLQGPDSGAWRRTWALGDRRPGRRRQKRAWPDL